MHFWRRDAPFAATFQRLKVLRALRQDCQQTGVQGLWTVGSLAWGRFVCVTTHSDIDVYLVGSPEALSRCLTTSRLLAPSGTVLLPLLVALQHRNTPIDMVSAKVRFAEFPLSTVTLFPETRFVHLMNQEIPDPGAGDFVLRLCNLRPEYQHQVKRAYAFDGSWVDLKTPFVCSEGHLPGTIRQDLFALSHAGQLRATLFVSHLLTRWLLWDRDGSIAQGITRFTSKMIQRYLAEYPNGKGEGLLNIAGINERMPWWLRWIWRRRFNVQIRRKR